MEDALHSAFSPHRINASREFFRIDPYQVEALLEILPGRDVTPRISEQASGLAPEDREAMYKYNRTNESEFWNRLVRTGRPCTSGCWLLGSGAECRSGGARRDSP